MSFTVTGSYLTVDASDLARLTTACAQAPQIIRAELTTTMRGVTGAMTGTAKGLAPSDTGRFRGSIHDRVEAGGDAVTGIVTSDLAYAIYVELGRAPGKQPPIAAIAGWAARHGLNPYLVARAIGRRGVRPKYVFDRTLKQSIPMINARFDLAGGRIVAQIGALI